MDSSIASLSRRRNSPQHQTELGNMCGTDRLFRDRYRLLRPLGRGGFGITFLAQDVALPSNPLCVIKQLCPKVSNPIVLSRASERFEREAKTLSNLGSHAHIPQLLNYFADDGEFYLIQEYIRGRTLAREVKSFGIQSEALVKQFLQEILPVLDYIHQHQVIHRDIKPPNIIRCQDDGRLVLIDFGAVKEQIARLDDFSHKQPTTQFVGTVGFAPPEQLALRPTFASDIYAIGVTCLYLLTGRPPLEFEYDPRTSEIRWRDDVEVSEHFSRILDKMLKISPRDRYQTAEQVMRALDLEPHLDQLADCMNAKARPSNWQHGQDQQDGDRYISPITRTAEAIRQWRSRSNQRVNRRRPNDDGMLISSGYLG